MKYKSIYFGSALIVRLESLVAAKDGPRVTLEYLHFPMIVSESLVSWRLQLPVFWPFSWGIFCSHVHVPYTQSTMLLWCIGYVLVEIFFCVGYSIPLALDPFGLEQAWSSQIWPIVSLVWLGMNAGLTLKMGFGLKACFIFIFTVSAVWSLVSHSLSIVLAWRWASSWDAWFCNSSKVLYSSCPSRRSLIMSFNPL